MSDTTNVTTKQKQLYHDSAANAQAVSDAVDALTDIVVNVQLPTGSDGEDSINAANDSVCITMPVNCKLQSAYLTATNTITSTGTDTILVTVKTNGVTAATFNSDTLAAAISANGVSAITVNTVNSFVDAGEVVLIAYTMEDNANNYIEGELILGFRRV